MGKHHDLIALGKQIRVLRKENGFTQENFADYASLDRSYYGAIERGERNVSAINLILIARALQVPVGDLFLLVKGNSKR